MLGWMILPYRRYAEFEGRSRRREFWSFVLFYWLVNLALSVLFGRFELVRSGAQSPFFFVLTGGAGPIGGLLGLVSLVPSLAVAVRRLHDQNRSGWLLLLYLIPLFGWFALLVLFLLSGTQGTNRYGPDPKQPGDAEVFR